MSGTVGLRPKGVTHSDIRVQVKSPVWTNQVTVFGAFLVDFRTDIGNCTNCFFSNTCNRIKLRI